MRAEKLLRHELSLAHVHEWGDVANAVLGKHVLLLKKTSLDILRRGHDPRAGERVHHLALHERRERVDHRREQDVDLALLPEHKLTIMAGDAFDRIAAIDRAAPAAKLAALAFGCVRGENDAVARHPQRSEETQPELVCRPDIEDLGNPDSVLGPRLPLRRVPKRDGRLLFEPFRQC